MLRRKILTGTPALALAAGAQNDPGWSPFARQWRDGFVKLWDGERAYTIAVAEAMPEDGYTFKPMEIQRPYGEQLVHLGSANRAYMNTFGVLAPPELPKGADKATTLKVLHITFDYVRQTLEKLTERDLMRTDLRFNPRIAPHTGTDLFMRAYTHTAHHRGQCIGYLRLKGVEPPRWAFEPSGRV